MKTETILLIGAGVLAVSALSGNKLGTLIGKNIAGVTVGTVAGAVTGTAQAVSGAVEGVVEAVTIQPYEWQKQFEYIPLIDDVAYGLAYALNGFKTPLGAEYYKGWL